jgi:integrase
VRKILYEWRADWMASGCSAHTIDNYQRHMMGLFKIEPDLDAWDLAMVREWIAEGGSDQIRRMRARSAKAFLRWATEEEISDTLWFRRIKLPSVKETPHETATEADYRRALAKAHAYRDRGLLAVLWSSGMRRAEVARMRVEHIDLDGGNVLVPISKTGKFPGRSAVARSVQVVARVPPQAPTDRSLRTVVDRPAWSHQRRRHPTHPRPP